MDEIKAIEVLRALAAGVHPATGELIAPGSPYETPETVRALFIAAECLEARLRQSRRASNLPRNAGKPWGREEDERLLAAYDAGTTVDELATAHERTRAGIEARLVRHGRLEEDPARPLRRPGNGAEPNAGAAPG